MPQYQLFVAIALIVAAACSFAINILSRQEGQIKLPVYNDANEDDEGLLPSVDSKDPFDVTKAEDFLDGYPLHEEGFWKKVRLLTPARFKSLTYSCTGPSPQAPHSRIMHHYSIASNSFLRMDNCRRRK